MRVQFRGLIALGAACGALMLVGCGSESVAGEAEAVGAGAGEPVFSPCDDIPEETLRAVGVDPVTESPDVAGVKQPGWNVCKWIGPDHGLAVYATTYTMDDVHSNPKFEEFRPIDLGDRKGTTFREVTDKERRHCDVALSSNGGAVMITITYLGGMQVVEEPCAVAARTARQLLPHIPS
ncbi:DUF3558 domain-containing protein [Rhodococcus maanshanensis]|uniref:DUF3558 domain-containing protein n=1 Tax=Rhodococcus maanshanensis TaxID=183556 RepID=UPI001FE34F17|nr:DUF3558 domain-containing protein [Rhodococcus maanshanensis]